jgi:hypothetical protein
MRDCSGFLWTRIAHAAAKHAAKGTSATKELGEEVFSSHAASSTALLKAIFPILVVYLSLLWI